MNQRLVYQTSVVRDESVEMWERICSSLATYHDLFLFTDFDGTLSDITHVPSAATIDSETRNLLRQLSLTKRMTVAVLSGRSVTDVTNRVGLPIIYGGDHGLEIHGSDFDYVAPGAEATRLLLPAICNALREGVQAIPGALVEAKRFTASLHYRLVEPDRIESLKAAVNECVDSSRFRVTDGKCVIEIRPRLCWNKGDATEWILGRGGAKPQQAICLGDDETDEDMFRRVPQGINVRILDSDTSRTSAPYSLKRCEVTAFLKGVLDVIQGISGTHADFKLPLQA
jgi:trehalose 6-phosphate phosphatase